MQSPRIPVAGPWVTDLEVKYASEAAGNDWYTHAGDSIGRFERAFADYLGIKYAFTVPNCTAALHLSVAVLGIGPGDEVIVPENTFVATAAPVAYLGATPIFADIDPVTWCMTPESVARCITPRTKAIITVDLYGNVPDMAGLYKVAQAHNIPIIEDSAQAIGCSWHDRPAGTLGDMSTFSFHGTKTMTTGEGGMICTDRDDLAKRITVLRDLGRTPGAADWRLLTTPEIGYKYRMGSMPAAFGLAQLERLPELIARKRQLYFWYRERLADIDGLSLNVEPENTFNTFWMTNIVVDPSYGLNTLAIMDLFDAEGVDTRPFFQPLSSIGAFAGSPDVERAKRTNTVAYDISSRSINLPSAMAVTEEQVDIVSGLLRRFLADAKRPAAALV
jgi:perosamine synthetase